MTHWPWWGSALALGAIPLLHWLLLERSLAVSGRITALVDRLRARGPEDDEEDGEAMSLEELTEALRDMVAVEYGEEALEATGDVAPVLRRPQTPRQHLVFLGARALGGLVSALLAGPLALAPTLRAETFFEIAQTPSAIVGMLFGGGLLVGFGTRMAGGCTSGHGLCGVSRLQPGSLAATAAFFGVGIVTSLLLGVMR